MKLSRVEIKNFRSIADSTVSFENPCRVLVGINESGKSNVLKALRLLSDDYAPSATNDVREQLANEDPITEAYIRFVFKFEKAESEEIFAAVAGRILANEDNPKVVMSDNKSLTLRQYCLTRSEGIHAVDLLKEKRANQYWGTPSSYKLAAGWQKPSEACPEDYLVGTDQRPLYEFTLVRSKDFPEIPADYLEPALMQDLVSLSGFPVLAILKRNRPEVIFWEYEERDLLPSSIDIAEFAAEPDTFEPLMNMFILAGIEEGNIQQSIAQARKGSPNQTQNYLDRIARQTTKHFRSVWAEYRDISFSLRLHAGTIVPGIKESNTHDFAKRSDGFKRFVTFLLLISVKVKTKRLENILLLVDEPEISLHPSGARYLRDELITISKQNYVVFSTHSIFMIDANTIERHYIVKKKNEVTTLKAAEESNLAEEEVLFNALGYSAFDFINEKNLIFEGWKDKRLFEVAIEKASAGLKKKFESVGICHAWGASTLKSITPLIALAKRDCLIVSDGDTPAIQEQKAYRAEKLYGTWLTYQEVDPSIGAVTGEDFVKSDVIVAAVNSALTGEGLPIFGMADLPASTNKLKAISDWLKKNGKMGKEAKPLLMSIKEHVFANLDAKHIEPEYTKLLNGLKP